MRTDEELVLKGLLFIKRLWAAWRAAKPFLERNSKDGDGAMYKADRCIWSAKMGDRRGTWLRNFPSLLKKAKVKGMCHWGQVIDKRGGRVLVWAEVKGEFRLKTPMKEVVEAIIEEARRGGIKQVERSRKRWCKALSKKRGCAHDAISGVGNDGASA